MVLLAIPSVYSFCGRHRFPCTNYCYYYYKSTAGKTLFPYKHQESSLHYYRFRKLRQQNYSLKNHGKLDGTSSILPNSGNTDYVVNVKRKKNVFSGRKWPNAWDVSSIFLVVAFHFLCIFAPFTFTWDAFWVAFGLYIITGFGITLGYHRLLSHRSFKLPKWLEYLVVYCGALACERDPIFWVSTHRCHHQFSDTENDPHSPIIGGFWFSHMGWIFENDSRIHKCDKSSNIQDLENQAFYKFLESTYLIHPLGLATFLYAVGGFPYLIWGFGVRIVWVHHITLLVNSACHIWGTHTWNTGDFSRNNWWVGLLALGEGWHNNHHAFEYSAKHGLEWWQIDVSWHVIRFLEIIGLATDVKVPTSAQKQRMASNNYELEDECFIS